MAERQLPTDTNLNRAARRARKVAAIGSGAVLAGGAGAAVVNVLQTSPAGALTAHVVTLNDDTGDGTCDATCTLRDAVDDSANDGDDSEITFAASVTGTITLTQGDILFANGTDTGLNLTITGPGSGALTVQNDGVTLDRIFNDGGNFGAATFAISGLTLANGNVNGGGGAINFYHSGNLALTNTAFTNNRTTGSSGNDGGAIFFYDAGNMTVTNTTFTGNFTANGADGGAVFFYQSGSMSISGSTFTSNTATGSGDGGAIRFYQGNDLTVTGSTFTGNDGDNGGAIKFYKSRDLTVTDTTISGNTSTWGGGVKFYNNRNMVVTNSVISGNHAVTGAGGGIDFYLGRPNVGGVNSSLTVTSSTISGNDAFREAGGLQLYDDAAGTGAGALVTVTIVDSTISGNRTTNPAAAAGNGGGFYSSVDNVTIANSTIANNSAVNDGGGGAVRQGNVTLLQSTISGNTAGTDANDFGDGLYLRGPGAVIDSVGAAAAAGDKDSKDPDRGKTPKPGRDQVGAAAVGAAAVGTVNVLGTIVSANGTEDIGSQSTASLTSTNSLLGTTTAGITINDAGGTIISTTPGLAALASNGGPTQTMALLANSTAINAGPTTVPSFANNQFDQRGFGFPRVFSGRVDIGAYEFRPPEPRFTG